MQAAIIEGVTVGEDGCVDGYPTARFVEQAPGPPILGSVLMLICDDLTEFENVLEDLPGRGFRDDFYSRVGSELWHWTSSKYGKHAYSGLQVFGECDQGMLFILVILVISVIPIDDDNDGTEDGEWHEYYATMQEAWDAAYECLEEHRSSGKHCVVQT